MIENWFKKKLNVPDHWDKHDFEQQRYSFNDMVDFAEQYYSEQQLCECDSPLVRTSDKGGEYCGLCEKNLD